MKQILFILLLLFYCITQTAYADCAADLYGEMVCGMGKCKRDQYGNVFCSRFNNGGALRDGYGTVYCGIGDCARDQYSKVYCSKVVGGGAARDRYGKVKCAGGCEPGHIENCILGEE